MNSVKFQDTKVIQRNLFLLYIQTIRKRNEENDSIYNASNRIKYLGINITKEVNICTLKTINHWWKKLKTKKKNKWNDMPCSWVGILNIIKMNVQPRKSTDLVQSLSKSNGMFT